MMKELKKTRQIPGEPFRRWFSGNFMELIVWYNDKRDSIIGFQLCYRIDQDFKALTWQQEVGYSHANIDDGEGRSFRSKMSPVLVPDGKFKGNKVLEQFMINSEKLDQHLVEFISQRISSYQENIE